MCQKLSLTFFSNIDINCQYNDTIYMTQFREDYDELEYYVYYKIQQAN